MKLRMLLAAILLTVACRPATKPTNPPVPQPKLRAVGVIVIPAGPSVVKLHVGVNPERWLEGGLQPDGVYLFPEVDTALRDTDISVTQKGCQPYHAHKLLPNDLDSNGNVSVTLNCHVDPAKYSLQQLMLFRGSLFTVKACSLPFGPRPGQPDNIANFAARFYTRQERQCVYDAWKARGYTHAVIGPFVDPGYHGVVPDYDFRDNPQPALDLLQEIWDQGFLPIVAVVPDHWGRDKGYADHVWTVDDLKAGGLDTIYRTPEFQRLVRSVMLCWECMGDRYGFSNRQYVAYVKWMADAFPNAVRILHGAAKVEVPVGNGDQTDTTNCGSKARKVDCLTNGEAWGNVTPYIHAFFYQDDALFDAQTVADNGKTNERNWLDLWDRNSPYSFPRRFADGYANWPTFSANPPEVNGGHLCVVAGEYMSYPIYWRNVAESVAQNYGKQAVDLGSCGAMDGWAK